MYWLRWRSSGLSSRPSCCASWSTSSRTSTNTSVADAIDLFSACCRSTFSRPAVNAPFLPPRGSNASSSCVPAVMATRDLSSANLRYVSCRDSFFCPRGRAANPLKQQSISSRMCRPFCSSHFSPTFFPRTRWARSPMEYSTVLYASCDSAEGLAATPPGVRYPSYVQGSPDALRNCFRTPCPE
ncbi:MAG: hypothetical protein SFY69_06240 [Planctomycetota bacterium]|nr:hypothetical protein [Planctomycetota bacterium]